MAEQFPIKKWKTNTDLCHHCLLGRVGLHRELNRDPDHGELLAGREGGGGGGPWWSVGGGGWGGDNIGW